MCQLFFLSQIDFLNFFKATMIMYIELSDRFSCEWNWSRTWPWWYSPFLHLLPLQLVILRMFDDWFLWWKGKNTTSICAFRPTCEKITGAATTILHRKFFLSKFFFICGQHDMYYFVCWRLIALLYSKVSPPKDRRFEQNSQTLVCLWREVERNYFKWFTAKTFKIVFNEFTTTNVFKLFTVFVNFKSSNFFG